MEITATEFLKGIDHELKFWQGFVKTERFIKGWVAQKKTPELQQVVHDFIQSNTTPKSKVLDVGSGVVSILNGTLPANQITTADPLGGIYEVIFDYKKYGIKSPEPYPGEELPYHEEFDIVHMSNAIDHAQNPISVLDKLYEAVKKGGYLILQGFENEGSFENWQGFHQWDIKITGNTFTLKNKEGLGADVNFSNVIKTEHFQFESKTWYVWIIQKS